MFCASSSWRNRGHRAAAPGAVPRTAQIAVSRPPSTPIRPLCLHSCAPCIYPRFPCVHSVPSRPSARSLADFPQIPPHRVTPPTCRDDNKTVHVASLCRSVEAPMARLGSPGCHVDVCLRRGGEEAGLVVSTGLPQPTAFERLRRRENEILKSVSQRPNDCCSATRVDSKADRGESDTTHPYPLPITLCALSAQLVCAGCAGHDPRC